MRVGKCFLFVIGIVLLCSNFNAVMARNADLSNWMQNLSGNEPDDLIADDHNPEIVVAGNIVHVVWTAKSTDLSHNFLYYRRSTDGGTTWNDTVTLAMLDVQSEYENPRFRRLAVSGNYVHIIAIQQVGNWHYELQYFRSDDSGQTFSAPEVIFTGEDAYWVRRIMISCDANYVTIGFVYNPNWYDAYTIYTLDSSDNGMNFALHAAASSEDHAGDLSDLLRIGNHIYLLYYHLIENYYYGHWQASIKFAGSTDGGQSYTNTHTFTTPAENGEYLTYSLFDENNTPNLAVSGNNVYVLWTQNDTAYDSDNQALYFSRSTNQGSSFSAPALIANRDSVGYTFQVGQEMLSARGNNVYVTYMTPAGRIFLRRSGNSGQSFEPRQELTAENNEQIGATGWWPVVSTNPFDSTGSSVFFFFTSAAYRYSTDAGNSLSGVTYPGPVFSWRGTARPKIAFSSDGAMHYVLEGACTLYSSGVFGDSDIFYQRIEPWSAPDPGSTNKAMKFTTKENAGDGTGDERFDCMEIPASPDINFSSAMTIEAWINPDVDNSYESYFLYKADQGEGGSWASYMLGRWRDGHPDARIATTAGGFVLTGGEPIPSNQWTHIAITYDANAGEDNFRMYVNGTLVRVLTATGNLVTNQGILFVGGYNTKRYHDSITIDELRFWNRALSSAEINQRISTPLTGSESGLTAYYNFDNTTKDVTGHGNNGQLCYKEAYVDGFVPNFPTPTPTPSSSSTGVTIDMPTMAHPGEQFWVTGYLNNGTGATLSGTNVFFVLQIGEDFWFWPSWVNYSETGQFDFDTRDVPTTGLEIAVLPEFTWPDTGDATLNGLHFLGAMLTPDMSEVYGSIADVEWGFGPK